MHRITSLGILLFTLAATVATAQPAFLGQPFPLTNTRYGAEQGFAPRLVSDGRDFYLFWASTSRNVRMTKMVAGERRAGKSVLAANSNELDVLWTGQHFLVVATDNTNLVGQLVTAGGDPVGGSFLVAEGARNPRLGFNGTTVVLLYEQHFDWARVWAATMSRTGVVQARKQIVPQYPESLSEVRFDIASNGDGFAVTVLRSDHDRVLTLDRNGNVRSEETLGANGIAAHVVPHGTGYLVAASTNSYGNGVSRIDANGTIIDTVSIDMPPGAFAEIVPSGSGYVALMWIWREGRTVGQVVHLDANGERVTAIEPMAIAHGSWRGALQLAGNGQRFMTAWLDDEQYGYVAELPLTPSAARAAMFGAGTQIVLATAAGSDASMVVWSEINDGKPSIRAGTRGADGAWNETTLSTDYPYAAVAASDGREFVVLYADPDAPEIWLHRVSSSGAALAPRVAVAPLPSGFVPNAIVWNGERYVITGIHYATGGSYAAAAFVTADGAVTGLRPMSQPGHIEAPRIAWNGQLYLGVWRRWMQKDGVQTMTTEAVRLDRNLQRLDAAELVVGKDIGEVVWDGTHFVVLTKSPSFSEAIRVSSAGAKVDRQILRSSANVTSPGLAAAAGGIVVTWSNAATLDHHVTVLRQGMSGWVMFEDVFLPGSNGTMPLAVALPRGRAAVFAAEPNDAAPHHGARRIMASILDLAPLSPLDTAPRVTATRQPNNRVSIAWTALAQPVTGYRVEYRIGDGNWNELERSPDPAVRTASFTITRPGTTYAFRVRAMNHAGMGPYSEPAIVAPAKRRAVR